MPLVFDIERMSYCLCQHCNNGGERGASQQIISPVSEIITDTDETGQKYESSFFLEVEGLVVGLSLVVDGREHSRTEDIVRDSLVSMLGAQSVCVSL